MCWIARDLRSRLSGFAADSGPRPDHSYPDQRERDQGRLKKKVVNAATAFRAEDVVEKESDPKKKKKRVLIVKRWWAVKVGALQEFAKDVFHIAVLSGLLKACEVVVLLDGERGLKELAMAELKLPDQEFRMILDWHHRTRAIGKCAKVLYPAKKEKKQRTNWAKKIRRALWRGKVDKALAQLEQKRRHVRRANKREALDALITYIKNNREIIPDEFRMVSLGARRAPADFCR